MEITPQFATTTRVDSRGEWALDSVTSVTPGFHQVYIRDSLGDEVVMPLYVAEGEKIFVVESQVETQWLDRIQSVISPAFLYAIFGLILLLIIATLVAILASRKHTRRMAIIASTIIMVCAALGALYLNMRVGVPSAEKNEMEIISEKTVDIRGVIKEPLTDQPVSGVNVTLDDTSIRTASSGQYAFPQAQIGKTLRINHPMLRRAIGWRVTQGGVVNIPFDAELYNALDQVLEGESGATTEQMLVIRKAVIDQSKQFITLTLDDAQGTARTFQRMSDGWLLKRD